jgi:ATP-binding cassette, subfamily B, bacterial
MEKVNPIKRLFNLVLLDKKEILSIYFYAILSGLVQLSVPLGVQAIISFVLGASMVTSIYVLIFVVTLGVVLVGILQINQMKIIEKIQQRIFTRNAFEFSDKIPQIDLLKANSYYLSEKVNRFFDTVSVQKGISKILLDIPLATIQIVFGLLLLTFYHPIFSLFGLMLILTIYFVIRITSRKGWTTSLEESNNKYAVVAWFAEMTRMIKSFKFRHGTHMNLQKTDENVVGYLSARTSHFKVLLFQYRSLVLLKVLITLTMLVVGTYLLLHQILNVGEFIAAEIVILSIIAAVEKLIGNLDNVYDVITGLEKLASVTEMKSEKNGKVKYVKTEMGTKVELIDFNFSFPEERTLFENSTISIPPNSFVLVSGEEGVGKTSLLNIFCGNYLSGGGLLINGIPIPNYDLISFRKCTGIYLNQREIFSGTLLENISMGRKDVLPDTIVTLADDLGFTDFAISFKSGFETVLEPQGHKLSSTTIQKILLLRSLVGATNLLLLDEPLKGFEGEDQVKIVNYLLKLKNTTIIIVSKNLMLVDKATIHLKIENKQISLVNKL